MIQNITDLARKIGRGKLTSTALVDEAFERIAAPEGQGDLAFLSLYRDQARAQAGACDKARADGLSLPPHAGVPLAIKDLFDVRGEVTRAGSRVLDTQPPATRDAEIVRRLRQAGFVIVGKNNMTEFAYSGLGVNGHFGTPRNPHDPEVARVPGGSTSGGAVAVAEGMVPAVIGTDTGGSCRIPAAFCGIVGFKPTSTRVPKAGCVPLSKSLDSIGPLATSVSDCAVLDSILSGGQGEDVESFPEGGLRIGVLEGYVTEHLDATVAEAFQNTLSRLSQRGVRLLPLDIRELGELPTINAKGGLVGAEAYAWHKPLLETRAEFYDPWVYSRFEAGKSQSAEEYIRVLEHRQRLRALVAERQAPFDALILPTVQIVAPTLEELETTEKSGPINLLCLRNTAVGNFLDLPAISIPCQAPGSLPVGAMLMGANGQDRRLLSIARGLEQTIRGQ
ncbi:amidase [Frigidibacter sp. ROC022]|uniref:amidase n=1 Tax=Frigidibacter sp. ROC022 TaxID=2971796 RepID=UPI00215ACBD4|nr:amidase [Frigidibacter sp. ROC022]MCR8726494.1 amidase [Frigidibacter sp. ROC022]